MVDLKNYICTVPFDSMELHNNFYSLCCPSWMPKKISRSEHSIKEIWNSDSVLEIRESILNGSYKFCDKEVCPHLSKVIAFDVETGPIKRREKVKLELLSKNPGPDNIIMNFDRSCNFKCPSCRTDLIIETAEGINRIKATIEDIDKYYSKSLKTIYITGTGDPFVSVGFRNYLRNFNPNKYPNLQNIHLHTNASMWTEQMWNSMPNIHKYVHSCEISIDAGTKETYETKTRLGGKWENLINNLKFISTIKSIHSIKTSFVVQDSNYSEMETFYDLMYSIFGNKVNVYFARITNWGTFGDTEWKIKQIWDKQHPEHEIFINEFQKIWKKQKVTHNLYEFIQNDRSKKSLI